MSDPSNPPGERGLQAHHHYLTIAMTMTEGAMLLEADGTIVAANPSAERILGVRAEDVVGVTHSDPMWRTIHEDGSPFVSSDYPVAISLREGIRCTNVMMGTFRADNSLRWIRISSTPLFHEHDER